MVCSSASSLIAMLRIMLDWWYISQLSKLWPIDDGLAMIITGISQFTGRRPEGNITLWQLLNLRKTNHLKSPCDVLSVRLKKPDYLLICARASFMRNQQQYVSANMQQQLKEPTNDCEARCSQKNYIDFVLHLHLYRKLMHSFCFRHEFKTTNCWRYESRDACRR